MSKYNKEDVVYMFANETTHHKGPNDTEKEKSYETQRQTTSTELQATDLEPNM